MLAAPKRITLSDASQDEENMFFFLPSERGFQPFITLVPWVDLVEQIIYPKKYPKMKVFWTRSRNTWLRIQFLIASIRICFFSIFETPFDHFHSHPTSGLISWHSPRLCLQDLLSDPGIHGVRSMGPCVSNWETLGWLNWCDSGWWRYQRNTNW